MFFHLNDAILEKHMATHPPNENVNRVKILKTILLTECADIFAFIRVLGLVFRF